MTNKVKREPNTPLSNPQREKFCHLVVSTNDNMEECMNGAGYKPNRSYFCQLKAFPEVKERIAEIIAENTTDKVCGLNERLEILSDMVRDVTVPKSIRIRALAELHKQSGDDIQRLDVSNNSVIQYVEVELPKQQEDSENVEIDENTLEGLDQWLNDLEE